MNGHVSNDGKVADQVHMSQSLKACDDRITEAPVLKLDPQGAVQSDVEISQDMPKTNTTSYVCRQKNCGKDPPEGDKNQQK